MRGSRSDSGHPRVSVGLPVYNGQDYLEEAIDSILGQTFDDFELIISDNASTDRTEEICRAAAARDARVRYIRRPENIGGAANFNAVFALARGELFKWMAHDDACLPDFLRVCVEALDADPSVVLAYPSAIDIDPQGRVIGPRDRDLEVTSDSPYERFRALMCQGHAGLAQFGVIRRDVLARTPLLQPYDGSDRPLLNELALHGRLLEVRQELFLHREHPKRSVYAAGRSYGLLEWWDPARTGRITLPAWRRLRSYLGALRRVPIPAGDRLRCLVLLAGWVKGFRHRLLRDLVVAAGQLGGRLRTRVSAGSRA